MRMLQTYQLSASRSPERGSLLGHRGELFYPQLQPSAATPVHLPGPLVDLRPEALIQCQQIVKVIVLDKGGHGRVEAFLSHTPTHRFIRSALSTPSGPPRAGTRAAPAPSPPASAPPPYNHPHQYCPPQPPPAARPAEGLQRLPQPCVNIN
ncbi:hypothetical protein ANANG_G00146160 [Anguilla anguilla]|uniref:Uncharacterized protein n=1 Tax=Anguilla anguilla TaxID=7936 RepID=A0A9D3MF36_ANGAN|nr:hypothetical protein ANANG_G00146160 [Anguilla anguilla]